MICPQCDSSNVTISMTQTSGRTGHHGTGFGGHTNNALRAATALMTMGTSNLVWKKSKGTSKTKFKHTKTAICQECGNSWKIK